MRITNNVLKKARRWLASGRNTKVIRYLEPEIPNFLEDPDYYALLGRACLHAGVLKDADLYLSRGLQADPSHLDVRLTLAVTHLKRKDPSSAVRTWLEILEDHPEDKRAKRGLRTMKHISDQNSQDRFLERFDPNRFLPDITITWPRRVLTALLLILVLLMILYARRPIVSAVSRVLSPPPPRSGSRALRSAASGTIIGSETDVLHFMTENEAARTLKRALRYFERYQDNSARHELNKIRRSNADEEIRLQAALLIESLGETDIETIETDFSFAQVSESPWLFEDCLVLWRGVTANVIFNDDAIRFDFLVGYQEGRVLEGRIPVTVPFLTVMEPLPLELLARVRPSESGFTLSAETLHFLR